MFPLKGKHKTQKVRLLPVLYYAGGSNVLLCEPMVNFSAKFYCLAADEVAAFC